MPSGKIGDHPLTDIFAHSVDVLWKASNRIDSEDCVAVEPARVGRMMGKRNWMEL
jgi:hypothetical protein